MSGDGGAPGDDAAAPPLFAHLPAELAGSFDPQRPWTLLGEPLDALLDALPHERLETPIPPGVHLLGERIVIGKGVKLYPGVVLEGPLWIGEDSEIRPGAYLRGGIWVGKGCVVGTNVEMKRAILLDEAKAPHLNYVGDSVLGAHVNLGAGTILSNFRHDGQQIAIPTPSGALATGRRKLGAILGDRVMTGCNCVLHPGCVVGAGTQLYPGVMLRPGFYPARHLIKLRQEQQTVALR